MSSLPLSFNPPLFQRPQPPSDSNLFQFPILSKSSSQSLSKSHICFTFSPSNNANYEREEARWLREEQRWLREEQRWKATRESLLCEISALELKIQKLERQNEIQGASSVPDTVGNIATLLHVLTKAVQSGKLVNQIAESGASAVPMVMEVAITGRDELAAAEEVVVKEVIRVSEREQNEGIEEVNKRTTLRIGSKGDEVRVMQEGANGAAVASVKVQQRVVKEGVAEVEVPQHRVFLLGENRWEDPSRLASKNKQVGNTRNATTYCLSCRGEGRSLCIECDGTGEPNIEQQFLEWTDEQMKCPYCDGHGYTICDVCDGQSVVNG